jgi:predicted phage tail protein
MLDEELVDRGIRRLDGRERRMGAERGWKGHFQRTTREQKMNVDAMLRRIDEEITQHNQEIAARQVAIMRLQDSRRVLMGLAEGDQIKAEMARAERAGAPAQINGHAQPMLIVRRTGSGDEGPPPAEKKQRAKNRTGKRQYTSSHEYGGGAALRERVVELVKKTGPIIGREIGNRLNIPKGAESRQPLSNALYELKRQGVLERDESKLYSLARRPGMQ